jgi:hypothetical protein
MVGVRPVVHQYVEHLVREQWRELLLNRDDVAFVGDVCPVLDLSRPNPNSKRPGRGSEFIKNQIADAERRAQTDETDSLLSG